MQNERYAQRMYVHSSLSSPSAVVCCLLKAERKTAEAKQMALEVAIAGKREKEERQKRRDIDLARAKWLQTTYPLQLAEELLDLAAALSPIARKNFDKTIRDAFRGGFFKRRLVVPDLWEVNNAALIRVKAVKHPGGGSYNVRCTATFQQFLRQREFDRGGCPLATFTLLLQAVVPHAINIFTREYAPIQLLHENGYIIEKAFVYAIVCLSKWLGRDRFPMGIFGQWPPPMPGQSRGGSSRDASSSGGLHVAESTPVPLSTLVAASTPVAVTTPLAASAVTHGRAMSSHEVPISLAERWAQDDQCV